MTAAPQHIKHGNCYSYRHDPYSPLGRITFVSCGDGRLSASSSFESPGDTTSTASSSISCSTTSGSEDARQSMNDHQCSSDANVRPPLHQWNSFSTTAQNPSAFSTHADRWSGHRHELSRQNYDRHPREHHGHRPEEYRNQHARCTPTTGTACERISVGDLPAPRPLRDTAPVSGGNWVEVCIGQLPFGLSAGGIQALLVYCVPQTVVLRVMFQKKGGYRCGLCFVAVKDNGAAERLIATVHKAVMFDYGRVAVWARGAGAREEIQTQSAWRRDSMDSQRRGDGLPLSAMTVEWSRCPQNNFRGKMVRVGVESRNV